MRVAGYVRESLDPAQGRSAFAQHEEIRRHAAAHGMTVVAICQDLRGAPTPRDGYLALLGVLASGAAEVVLLPGLATLSDDQIVQEIMISDLLSRKVSVISTMESDLDLLDDSADPGATRMLIRDVLSRVREHQRSVGAPPGSRPETPGVIPDAEVMIHLVKGQEAEIELIPGASA
jgi:DNA invertase Pin-like site-specific DNA recombinase